MMEVKIAEPPVEKKSMIQFVGKWKFRGIRGYFYANVIIGIVNFVELVGIYHLPLWWVVPMTIGLILLCLSLGWADERAGTWGAETSHANQTVNPEFMEIVEWVREQKRNMNGDLNEKTN
jgi:hypothetical protein